MGIDWFIIQIYIDNNFAFGLPGIYIRLFLLVSIEFSILFIPLILVAFIVFRSVRKKSSHLTRFDD